MRRLSLILALLLAACSREPGLSPRLEAYFQAQKTGICEIHHVPMIRKVVDMSYGLPVHDDAFVEASQQFPHANAEVNGGCDVPAHPEKAAVFVCPKCREIARQWALRHPSNPDSEWVLEKTKT